MLLTSIIIEVIGVNKWLLWVVTNLQTGLDQQTNTLMHFMQSSPHFRHLN